MLQNHKAYRFYNWIAGTNQNPIYGIYWIM